MYNNHKCSHDGPFVRMISLTSRFCLLYEVTKRKSTGVNHLITKINQSSCIITILSDSYMSVTYHTSNISSGTFTTICQVKYGRPVR